MPKLFISLLITSSCFLFSVNTCLANTDPKSSTPSATATVPTTTPTTSDTLAPTIPILLRPQDATITGDHRPELVWRESVDENSNTVFYTVFLNDIATYLGVSGLGNSQGAGYTARIESHDIRLLPAADLPEGTYSWRVEVSDLSGNTRRSVTWHFTIDATPPPLTLVDLDVYHYPSIVSGSNFDITGPKDVYFVVHSDPYATIQITLSPIVPLTSPTEPETYHLSAITNASGHATLYQHLLIGQYSVILLSIDPARNSTFLPDFTLTLTQGSLTLPGLPPLTVPAIIHDLPATLTHLPATIAQLDTRVFLPLYAIILLAVLLSILLIYLWRRRYNLLLLDNHGQPLLNTKVYHSIPTTRARSRLLLTSRPPLSYILSPADHGRLYVSHLNRYSTLTIRTSDEKIYVLSLSAKRQLYTLVIG